MPFFAAAQDPESPTVFGTARYYLSMPKEGTATGIMLCLAGGALESAELHAAVCKSLRQPHEAVLTPAPRLDDSPAAHGFVPVESLGGTRWEEDRLLARILARSSIKHVVEKHQLAHVPLCIVAVGDGAVTAADLMLEEKLVATTVTLIAPDLTAMPDMDDLLPSEATLEQRRAAPGFDVFLDAATPDAGQSLAKAVRRKLGRLGDTARIYCTRLWQRGLSAVIDDVATATQSIRYVATAPFRDLTAETLVAQLLLADVVVFGEQHDSEFTHRQQAYLFAELTKRRTGAALALEMFERDVQPILDQYLAGTLSEADFLAQSRPWPNYLSDYRPMVELAKERKLPVLAANVPRRLAARVAKEGAAVLEQLGDSDKGLVAQKLSLGDGRYRERFMKVMKAMSPSNPKAPKLTLEEQAKADAEFESMMSKMFAAQCIKDDTMAETVVAYLNGGAGRWTYLVNGAFHSDGRLGVVEKLLALKPSLKIAVISGRPVGNPRLATPTDAPPTEADYVVLVPLTRPDPALIGRTHPKTHTEKPATSATDPDPNLPKFSITHTALTEPGELTLTLQTPTPLSPAECEAVRGWLQKQLADSKTAKTIFTGFSTATAHRKWRTAGGMVKLTYRAEDAKDGASYLTQEFKIEPK